MHPKVRPWGPSSNLQTLAIKLFFDAELYAVWSLNRQCCSGGIQQHAQTCWQRSENNNCKLDLMVTLPLLFPKGSIINHDKAEVQFIRTLVYSLLQSKCPQSSERTEAMFLVLFLCLGFFVWVKSPVAQADLDRADTIPNCHFKWLNFCSERELS